jgi:sulfur-carrier protein adenylyltransferase/sulfurtransferase
LDIRGKVFKRCYVLNVTAITAGPIRMETAILYFLPHKIRFEEYFYFNKLSDKEKRINILFGLNAKAISK